MKLAVIDIGSNAVRLQISTVLGQGQQVNFKKQEYIRFPLRLGMDVFNTQSISPEKEEKFVKLMRVFRDMMELYGVTDYMACATSAMREAANGLHLVLRTRKEVGLDIKIIEGQAEAEIINTSLFSFLDPDKTYLHVDVGGGSTELNLIHNKEKIASESFPMGSVRNLKHLESPFVWENMKRWMAQHINGTYTNITAIGTGGNINKLYELAGKTPNKIVSLERLSEVHEKLRPMSVEERINTYQLNPDRADVILPAGEIYLSAMRWAGSRSILVPNVGLKDGMLQALYLKNTENKPLPLPIAENTHW